MNLAFLVAAWVLGSVVATHAVQQSTVWLIVGAIGLIAAVAARRSIRWRWLFSGLLAFGLGAARMAATQQPLTTSDLAYYNDQGTFDMSGVVIDLRDVRDTAIR